MQVIKEGSVRVDLVGGTLDLDPIHVILKDVITLNVATSLKAKVIIERIDTNSIIIESLDYNSVSEFQEEEFTYENIYENDHFGPLKFFIQILDHFKIHKGLKIISNSGAPAGSGLGGSSAMGVTLYSAILDMQKRTEDRVTIVNTVKGIESRILNQGVAGYQDFYPALFGGVLGLKAAPGEVVVEQLYSQELKVFLEKNITLIFFRKISSIWDE
jgi:D-glycero-alpha-D-manno-heptose-7-phosphate kinase